MSEDQVPWPKLVQPLPTDFAMTVLNKEIQFDKTPSLPVLQEVIQLYSQAIEYYEHVKDPKYLRLQECMQQLIVKPQSMQLMNPSAARGRQEAPKGRDRSKTLNAMVERHRSQTKTIAHRAAADLSSQDSALERRLNKRKVVTANNSFNLSSFDTGYSGTANLSFDALLSAENDDFHRELETALEAHYAAETQKNVEVVTHYKVRMKELGDSFADKAAKQQLEAEMQQTLDAAKAAARTAKLEIVKKVRAQFSSA